MRKIILIISLSVLIVSPVFSAISSVPDSRLSLNFTAGLIANFGFSDRYVSSMVYPESNLLQYDNEDRTALSFSYDYDSGTFSTDSFYVFCQMFSTEAKVSLSGTSLTNGNMELEWQNAASGITLDSSGEEVDITPENIPGVTCYELVLRINKIPDSDSINWDATYTGSLVLTISAK